ncbi:hypothetical protein M2359_000460 [Gordonia amarae]|uniref:hypothetical protein n=1 Tax=Gordonia amarae TaxID=36821 RepID=UPI0011104ED8|nr:hypothetical protein [Gordonia amarae]MCS3876831.1 hypothetical protein [Gordonia amarae]
MTDGSWPPGNPGSQSNPGNHQFGGGQLPPQPQQWGQPHPQYPNPGGQQFGGPGGPPNAPDGKNRTMLWLTIGAVAVAAVMVAVAVVVFFVGDDDEGPGTTVAAGSTTGSSSGSSDQGGSDEVDYAAFVSKFLHNLWTYTPENMGPYRTAVATHCSDSPSKSFAEIGITAIPNGGITAEVVGTPTFEANTAGIVEGLVPVTYSMQVKTTGFVDGTMPVTGTAWVRQGNPLCIAKNDRNEKAPIPLPPN